MWSGKLSKKAEQLREDIDRYIHFMEETKHRKPSALYYTSKQIKELKSLYSESHPIHSTNMYKGIKLIETGK